jgi:hypothetical protein
MPDTRVLGDDAEWRTDHRVPADGFVHATGEHHAEVQLIVRVRGLVSAGRVGVKVEPQGHAGNVFGHGPIYARRPAGFPGTD